MVSGSASGPPRAIGGGGDNGAAAVADSIIDGIIGYVVDSRDPAYWLDPAN